MFSGLQTWMELLAARHYGESHGGRENLDWEGAVLTACRPAKRGNELRRVEPLKSFSDLMHELPFHWRSAAKGIRGLVGSSWKRDKGNP